MSFIESHVNTLIETVADRIGNEKYVHVASLILPGRQFIKVVNRRKFT